MSCHSSALQDSAPGISIRETAPVQHDPSLGTVHYIPVPKMRISAKKRNQYTTGETYKGWRLKTAFYRGIRTYMKGSQSLKSE
jgi:hypothetical protein